MFVKPIKIKSRFNLKVEYSLRLNWYEMNFRFQKLNIDRK